VNPGEINNTSNGVKIPVGGGGGRGDPRTKKAVFQNI
jgi:hypothetical protein